MKTKNCPNCAAPYEMHLVRCPYCSTFYADLSSVDIINGEPFYLKIRVPMNVNGKMRPASIIQKVVADNNISINVNTDRQTAYDLYGNKVREFVTNKTCSTDITFRAIQEDGVLFNVVMEDTDEIK